MEVPIVNIFITLFQARLWMVSFGFSAANTLWFHITLSAVGLATSKTVLRLIDFFVYVSNCDT